MTVRIGLLVAVIAVIGACAGDGETAEEPVKSDVEATAAEAPGDAGEASPKPAGEGQADVAQEKPPEPPKVEPTTDPAPEKSQPNYEAAAAATAAQKADALGKLENDEKDMFVSAWSLNVRSGPGMKFEVLSVVKRGEKVRVLEKVGIWALIGENRYVSINYLADNQP